MGGGTGGGGVLPGKTVVYHRYIIGGKEVPGA